ncbi:MAG: hypothetical protein HY925_12175, partial [Elusimicrobia bacterium]|nr:hypothetical protein [Elusimicrobiota bacterium]
MAAPRPPNPASSGRRGDYHLLYLAQQQIEQLQLFAARLQQQIRNLQAQLQDADDKVAENNRGFVERVKQAEVLRRMLPKLRERLEQLKPPPGAKPDLLRDKKLVKMLTKISARIETLEAAHDKQLKEALKPKSKVPPQPAADDILGGGMGDGDLSLGGLDEGGGGLELSAETDAPAEASPELLEAEDAFGDLELDGDGGLD